MTWLVTFFTHSGAIAFGRRAKGQGLVTKLVPVPRAVSSSCGTGARVECDTAPLALLDEDADKVFSQTAEGWLLTHDNDLAQA